MRTISIISFFGACIFYYFAPEEYIFSLWIATLSVMSFFATIYSEKKENQYLLNILMIKIQYETKIYDSQKIIKKVCKKAYKTDIQFYDKTPYRFDKKPYFIDDNSMYQALIQIIIEMQEKKNKWYGKFYSKAYWNKLDRLLIVFHR